MPKGLTIDLPLGYTTNKTHIASSILVSHAGHSPKQPLYWNTKYLTSKQDSSQTLIFPIHYFCMSHTDTTNYSTVCSKPSFFHVGQKRFVWTASINTSSPFHSLIISPFPSFTELYKRSLGITYWHLLEERCHFHVLVRYITSLSLAARSAIVGIIGMKRANLRILKASHSRVPSNSLAS